MKIVVLSFAHERAETYARLLHDMPDVELLIAEPGGTPENQDRARSVAEQLGVSYTDDFDDVLEWLPNAVVVTSEVDRRRELVERSAEAEAHVLCEQPLAVKEADVKAMVDACDIGGVRFALASPAAFDPAFATVRQGIADGGIGELTTIHGSYNTLPPAGAAAGAGALAANAPALLDLVDLVLGGEPTVQVYAQANGVLSGQPDVESAALITVRYQSGKVASIDCSWNPAAAGPVLTFVGDRAGVEYNAAPRLLGGFDAATGSERTEPGGTDLCAAMLRDFVEAFDSGEDHGPDGESGLRTQRIIQAAHESIQTGQPVDLG